MKKLFKKLIIYSIIGAILTIAPLYYLNNILFAQVTADEIKEINLNKVNLKLKNDGGNVPSDAQYLSLTNMDNVVAYLQNGQVMVKDIQNDNELDIISEENEIVYLKPLYDRNILLYFIYNDGMLDIKTYNLDTKEKMEHKSFKVKGFNKIKDVKYSSLTNVIYILLEINTNGTNIDKVYRIDIMKNVSLYLSDKNGIKDIELLNKEDRLIYQDYEGNVYDNGKVVSLKANKTKFKKFDILGIDESDNLYLLGKEEKSIFVCNDGKLLTGINVSSFEFNNIVNKNNRIYLINKNEVYDVINNKTTKIDDAEEIVDILNNKILYKRSNGTLWIN